jgi:TetR/AcrR family transcriptional repressor of nem operon
MSTSTKQELLHEASRMLLAKGLNGFSLQELASKLNIKKASLFHHYPSKNALAIELYRYYQAAFEAWAKENENLPPEKQIIAYGDKLTSWICEKQRVCPVGAMSLEWGHVPKDLQAEIIKLHEGHREWLTTLYREIKKTDGLKVTVNEAVLTTMGLLQGSIQLARLIEDPAIVTKNLKTFLKSIRENA